MREATSLTSTAERSEREARFEAILAAYRGVLRSAILKLRPRSHGLQLDDIEQDACLRLWRALEREKEITHPASYLHRIAASATIDAVRRARARREEMLPEEEGPRTNNASPSAAPAASSPEEIAQRREGVRLIEAALGRIHETRRTPVRLHLQGFNTREAASLLGCSEPKARNLIYRGLDELRRELRLEGIECEMV